MTTVVFAILGNALRDIQKASIVAWQLTLHIMLVGTRRSDGVGNSDIDIVPLVSRLREQQVTVERLHAIDDADDVKQPSVKRSIQYYRLMSM